MRVVPPVRWLKRSAALAVLAGASLSGLVSAQPAPPVLPPAEPAPSPLPPPGVVAEEAPPINVPPPAPIVVPPITEKEVAPVPQKAEAAKLPEVPVRRARYDIAIIHAIDKITAESLRFEAAVGRPVRYKNLVFTVRACERSAPDELVEDSIVYLTIDSQPRATRGKSAPPPRQAFRGWMYAASPALNPMEHPVYDAWLISCRTSAPVAAPVVRTVPVASAPAAKAPPAKAPAAAVASATPAPKAASPAPKTAAPAPKAASPAPKAAPPAPAAEPAPAAAPEPKA